MRSSLRLSRAATLLIARLRSMERDGIIDRRVVKGERGPLYYLTEAGEEFREVIELLATWGRRWMSNLQQWEYDLDLLMTALHGRLVVDQLFDHRVTIQFDFKDAPKQRWWLVLERPETELCPKDPGHEPDLYVTTDSKQMTMVHLGTLDLRQAIKLGSVELEGFRWAVQGFPRWIGHSHTVEWERKWSTPREAPLRQPATASTTP